MSAVIGKGGKGAAGAEFESGGLEQVAVALDTNDRDTFERWCAFFGPRVGVLKVGLEAYVRWGPPAVEIARRHARAIFLDLKLHDIPNTVAGAVRSARELDVDYLTLHAAGGPAMIAAAAEAAAGRVALLAVTVLTHLDEATLERLELPGGSSRRVLLWAHLARAAGAAGVVCSPLELAALRAAEPRPFQLVAPGIRPAGHGSDGPAGSGAGDDQRRTASAATAIAAGADLIVIGRPLTQAADPEAALAALAAELAGSSRTARD
jgi:orotidine-5'-phosphate decarboxylase